MTVSWWKFRYFANHNRVHFLASIHILRRLICIQHVIAQISDSVFQVFDLHFKCVCCCFCCFCQLQRISHKRIPLESITALCHGQDLYINLKAALALIAIAWSLCQIILFPSITNWIKFLFVNVLQSTAEQTQTSNDSTFNSLYWVLMQCR